MASMTDDEWYLYVPADEHAGNHRYCDPQKCPALLERTADRASGNCVHDDGSSTDECRRCQARRKLWAMGR